MHPHSFHCQQVDHAGDGKHLCCIRDWQQYCSYLGPAGSGEQYGRGMTTTCLLLRVGWDPRVFGIEYCLVNSKSVMSLNCDESGRCM